MTMLAEEYDFVIGGDPTATLSTSQYSIPQPVVSTRTLQHRRTAPDTPAYWPGRAGMHPVDGSGRWRGPEASPPDCPTYWRRPVRTSPKSAASNGPAARRMIASTRSVRHAVRWRANIRAVRRARGLREAIRALTATREGVLVSRTKAINELKSLIVAAPEHLRATLRGLSLTKQLSRIEASTTTTTATVEHRVTVLTLQSITARIRFLTGQLDELDPELGRLLRQHPAGPALLAQPGVGPVVAARLLLSWSHPGRVRNEAAFASLAGVAPLEASSGQRSRHRRGRGGDRALNRALHIVAITRLRCHPQSRAYEARRTLEGKTHRDIRRCLKRTLARKLYRVMEPATRDANAQIFG